MRVAPSVEDWLMAPRGAAVVGPAFVAWCASSKLLGSTHWGELETTTMPSLLRLLEVSKSNALTAPVDVILDGQDVSGFQDGAYRAALEAGAAHLPIFERMVGRQAIVLAAGVAGAVMAGIHQLVGSRYELRFFTSREDAFAWLVPERVRDTIATLIDTARGEDALLRKVRLKLANNLRDATLDWLAVEIGMSSRTLQRELRRRETSFRREQQHVRVMAAERLLADGNAKVDAVAREIGCASASHLATLMRKYRGRRPSELRRPTE